jgi:Lar family restriction alleviation protein
MTNGEKFKTAEERSEAYDLYCESMRSCYLAITHNEFEWLELEYTVALRRCPFCGGEAECSYHYTKNYKYAVVRCKQCDAITKLCTAQNEAITAWNRRAK